jgi:signal peptidase
MKMTFACPNCKTHKTVRGKPGEKKILVCDICNCKGSCSFPAFKPRVIKKYAIGFTKKQFICAFTAFIVCLLMFCFVIVPGINGDMHFLTVQSGSMEPDISVGDVVVSIRTNTSDIKVGDVITYRYSGDSDPDRCFTHRVEKIIDLEIGGHVFQTKGDANEDVDKRLVRPDEVIGKVSFVIPYLGYVGSFARSIWGYIVFIFIPALLIISFEIYRIYKFKKEDNSTKKIKV